MARNKKVKSAIVDLRAKLNKKRGNQKQNKFIGCHFCETKTVNIDHEQLRKGTDSDAVHIERVWVKNRTNEQLSHLIRTPCSVLLFYLGERHPVMKQMIAITIFRFFSFFFFSFPHFIFFRFQWFSFGFFKFVAYWFEQWLKSTPKFTMPSLFRAVTFYQSEAMLCAALCSLQTDETPFHSANCAMTAWWSPTKAIARCSSASLAKIRWLQLWNFEKSTVTVIVYAWIRIGF